MVFELRGPFTPATDILSSIDHINRAERFLRTGRSYADPERVDCARRALKEAEQALRLAYCLEPDAATAHEGLKIR